MKKKFFLVAVVLMVIVVGFTLGVGYAQKDKTDEPPLSKYLAPANITLMDEFLMQIKIEPMIASLVFSSKDPTKYPIYLSNIGYNYVNNKVTAKYKVFTDSFEKKTLIQKRIAKSIFRICHEMALGAGRV